MNEKAIANPWQGFLWLSRRERHRVVYDLKTAASSPREIEEATA